MRGLPKCLLPALIVLGLSTCSKKESPEGKAAPRASSEPSPAPSAAKPAAAGFDLDKVPIVNPQLGRFPYFGLIDGYQRSDSSSNKDVAFDRYEIYDGARILPVEGRLATIEADGKGASPFQVFKTYESLVTGLGGVKVFEGEAGTMGSGVQFKEARHREPVYDGDQMGVYVVRMPDKEIWVEAYVRQHGKDGTYFLTVVERKALEVKASLLAAEEMNRELDTKGHVALYINFDFDKATVKPDSQPVILEIVKLLKSNPTLSLTVEGHTDNVGTPSYNQQLSDARAKSVVAELTGQGIEARRLRSAGFGQSRPIADNSTDSGRAKNRRVELVKI